MIQENFINPTEAHQDVEIKEVCAQSGMKFDVLDLLKQEAQWWTTNAMRYADGVAQARDFDSAHVHVVRSLIKHKSDLLLLFTKYCEADYDARLSRSFRLSSFVTIGVDGGIHSSPLDIANETNEGVNMPQPPTTRKKKHQTKLTVGMEIIFLIQYIIIALLIHQKVSGCCFPTICVSKCSWTLV